MENGLPQKVENPQTNEIEIHVTQLSKDEAYDIVRKEFYTIRQQEQITKRVAIEEARMVGGYFGKNRLEVGMMLEDETYDRWRSWANKQIGKAEAKKGSAYQNFGKDTSAEGAELAELEMESETPEEPAPRL